jgi:predicted porin
VPDKARQYWMGVRYNVTGPLTLIGAAYRTTVNKGGGSANLFMAGADYALSKRTLLYASVGNVRNGGNANFSVETTNNNPAPGGSQTGFYVGMAHSF